MTDGPVATRPAILPAPAAERFTGADGLRALACLGVFFCHVQLNWRLPQGAGAMAVLRKFLDSGDCGVAIFFVLSGFLLSMPFWRAHRRGSGMPNLKVYALRRLARIAPGYWLCVLVMVLIAGAWHTRWDRVALLLTLSFTNSLLSGTYVPRFDGPLWSISVEMLFYVMLPLLALGMFRLRSARAARIYCLAVLVLLAVGQWLFLQAAPAIERRVHDPAWFRASAQSWATHQNAPAMFTHFLIGVLAADLYLVFAAAQSAARPAADRPRRRFNRYDLASAAILLLIAWSAADPRWTLPALSYLRFHWPTLHILVGLSLAMLPFSRHLGPWLDNRFLRTTATLSFGIYIWHVPVQTWVRQPLEHSLSPECVAGGARWYLGTLAFVVAALALTYAIAAASYFLFERPILRYAHRWHAPRPGPRLSPAAAPAAPPPCTDSP
jgi:peptidoglycan/LPS O-acetylase OafA/YrhL